MLLYVPATIPKSCSGLPFTFSITTLDCGLEICSCLCEVGSFEATVFANELNACEFISLTILSNAFIVSVVLVNPSLPIAPAVTSTISKFALLLWIFILPPTDDADTPIIFNALIWLATLCAVGLLFELYVPAVIPISDNALPAKVILEFELWIVNKPPVVIVAVIPEIVVNSTAIFSNLLSLKEVVVDSPKSCNAEPDISKIPADVSNTNSSFAVLLAITFTIFVLMLVITASTSSPDVKDKTVPLICNTIYNNSFTSSYTCSFWYGRCFANCLYGTKVNC